jgi:hypothetical protein
MCAELNFNAQGIDPAETFEPVPTNWYPVCITASEIKATKDNTGAYLELKLQIQDGDYAKRVAFARLNLQNANPVAVEIAQRQLSAICHATGVLQVADSTMLHGHPFDARIVYRPEKKDELGNVVFDASNEVKGFRPVGGKKFNSTASGTSAAAGTPAWVTEGNSPPATAKPPATATPPQAAAAPPPVTPAAPPATTTGPVMTAKANGVPYEAFIKEGWSDDLLLENGYIEPASMTSSPVAAAAPPTAAAAPLPETASKPPWAQ